MSSKPANEGWRWSIGRRLTMWYAGASVLLIGLTGTFLDRTLEHLLERQINQSLAEKLHIIQKLALERPPDLGELRHEIEVEWGHNDYAKVWLRVLDLGRKVAIAKTPGLPEFLTREQMPPPLGANEALERSASRVGPDGSPYRVMSALAGRHGEWIVDVAYACSREAEFQQGYRRVLILLLSLACLVALPIGRVIARRGLVAIDGMSDQVQSLNSTNLHRRLGIDDLPAELVNLATTFNAMLDRLQQSFERLSQFSSDLAHELRTPLSNLRGTVQVAFSRPRDEGRYRDVLLSVLEEGERLNSIVDGMLFLARAENNQGPIPGAFLKVLAELEKIRDYFEPAAQEREITITAVAPAELHSPVDPVLFNRALTNLVSNALEHTPPGGQIRLVATRTPDGNELIVTVADTGRGIAPEHLVKIFDRFYRVDSARGGGGIGLGLAIVASIAHLHGGKASATSVPGKGTTIELRLPLSGQYAAERALPV